MLWCGDESETRMKSRIRGFRVVYGIPLSATFLVLSYSSSITHCFVVDGIPLDSWTLMLNVGAYAARPATSSAEGCGFPRRAQKCNESEFTWIYDIISFATCFFNQITANSNWVSLLNTGTEHKINIIEFHKLCIIFHLDIKIIGDYMRILSLCWAEVALCFCLAALHQMWRSYTCTLHLLYALRNVEMHQRRPWHIVAVAAITHTGIPEHLIYNLI